MSIDSFHTSGHSPGPDFDKPAAVFPTASRCRVGLLGFGTVGSAVARRLASHAVPGLDLTHIFDRRAHQKRNRLPSGPGRILWTARVDDVLTSDVVVEAIGGIEPAAQWIRAALLAGKSVVTANKQLVARHGPALRTLAARQGRQLRFEAAVGGAMPIVRAVEGLAGDRLTRIVAVLNGTTNAVLSRMEDVGIFGTGAGGDATAVAVISDLVAIAGDRAAIVPAPVLSAPRAIAGLHGGNNMMATTSSAEFAVPVEKGSLCGLGGLRVDRFLEAEAL